jgi:general secretion pathway protein G
MTLHRIRNSRGMTLIEIMIVITILASLGAILATKVVAQGKKAKVREAKIQIGEISKALDMYYTDCGHYPDSSQGFAALAPGGESSCTNWGPEPYLKKVPVDPWGRPFQYSFDNGNYTITSFGEDGQPGGTGYNADITNE